MKFTAGHLYHVYNQGNNQEKLFYTRDNYLVFLKKLRELVVPHCHLLAWCLMPNHYHFLIGANHASVQMVKVGGNELFALTNGFRVLQVSYAQYLNRLRERSGSLFRQKAKAKCLTEEAITTLEQQHPENFYNPYPWVCFHYIHQNPWKAGLANTPWEWEFSSCRDFAEMRQGTLTDTKLAIDWIGLTPADLTPITPFELSDERVEALFVKP